MNISFFRNGFLAILMIVFSSNFLIAQEKQKFAIATLLNIYGFVEVVSAKFPKGGKGKHGMLMYAGDKVRTSSNSKATVEYRDGSRVRLFQNSEIVLQSSKEQASVKGAKRSFKYNLSLKTGSMRARFKRGFQRTKIRTPIALIGIKGTTIHINDNGDNATVSLTEGLAEVSNASSSSMLNPGQWLSGFSRTDDLQKKVTQIPNLLYLKTEEYELDFKNKKPLQVMISIQLQDSLSGKLVKRTGLINLETDYYSIRFPTKVKLDKLGFTRFPVFIDPPRAKDPDFEGLISIRAYIDNEQAADVGEGSLVLKVKEMGKKSTFVLDPDQGVIQKN